MDYHAGKQVIEFCVSLPFHTDPRDLIGQPVLQDDERVGYIGSYLGVRQMAEDSSWRIEYETYHLFQAVLDGYFKVGERE
jgi:hypothetical protein